ncbi:putative signal transducing protein [Polaribacter sp.]|uniref:putative signal transducing protein n=1 Tax=Polaribacter sp. TaxID=1920175 RepID=UPI003F6D31F2
MNTEHIKVFTGSSIIVQGLKKRLSENNIGCLIKDHINSSQVAGFGPLGNSVELFVLNIDKEKAQPIIDTYKAEINS